MTAIRRLTAPVILAAALALTGCGTVSSLAAPASTPASSAPPAAAPSSSALAAPPSPAASPAPCTSHACIVYDAQGLVGAIAKDESVLTKMDCYQSTVKHAAPGIWTVSCLATYSDGSQWDGIATVLLTSGQVTWEAIEQVQ